MSCGRDNNRVEVIKQNVTFKYFNKAWEVAEIVSGEGSPDLFVRLPFLAATHNISIEKILEYR